MQSNDTNSKKSKQQIIKIVLGVITGIVATHFPVVGVISLNNERPLDEVILIDAGTTKWKKHMEKELALYERGLVKFPDNNHPNHILPKKKIEEIQIQLGKV